MRKIPFFVFFLLLITNKGLVFAMRPGRYRYRPKMIKANKNEMWRTEKIRGKLVVDCVSYGVSRYASKDEYNNAQFSLRQLVDKQKKFLFTATQCSIPLTNWALQDVFRFNGFE